MKINSIIKLTIIGILFSAIYTSENGGYYECNADKLSSEDLCYFQATTTGKEKWGADAVENVVDRTGADFYRGLVNAAGSSLLSPKDGGASPLPWTNGDKETTLTIAIADDGWSVTLIFELIAPLRNLAMYHPNDLKDSEDLWIKWTQVLNDCAIKNEEEVVEEDGKTIVGYTTDTIYSIIKKSSEGYTITGSKISVHNFILQFLEEAAIDLVCLATELDMPSRCDPIREKWGMVIGDRNNCWWAAYRSIYTKGPTLSTPTSFKKYTLASTTALATTTSKKTALKGLKAVAKSISKNSLKKNLKVDTKKVETSVKAKLNAKVDTKKLEAHVDETESKVHTKNQMKKLR